MQNAIQNGFYPKIERESTLSDMLQEKVEDKYFLSEKVTQRLMSYRDNKEVQYNQRRYNAKGVGAYVVERKQPSQEIGDYRYDEAT